MKGILAALAAFVLGSCAYTVTDMPSAPHNALANEIRIETGDVLVKYLSAQKRLWNVAGPILIANASLCPRQSVTSGFTVLSDFDLPKQLRSVAYERALLNSDAQVQAVYGQAAFGAGIRAGDIVMTLDGRRVRNAGDFRARLRKYKTGQSATYGLLRNGQAFSVRMPFTDICRYGLVYLAANRDINAWTDGKAIYVTQGELDFDNDRELAVVLGHELAHDVMNHPQKSIVDSYVLETLGHWTDNAFDVVGLDTNFENLARMGVSEFFDTQFEREADYVGLYLVARAGGDISVAAPYWRRFTAEHGLDYVHLSDAETRNHPDDPERFVAMEATTREIAEKLRKDQPLMPNLKSSYKYGQKYFWWDRDNDDSDDEPDDDVLNH